MTGKGLYTIDTIKDFIGKEIGVTEWLTIDQDRVDRFADVTEDHNPLHVDEAIAGAGPFGTTVAHGFLTLSLLTRFAELNNFMPDGVKFGVNYGFERIRFMAPVPVGCRIRNRQTLLGAADKGKGRTIIRTRNAIEIENVPTPAMLADWLVMAIREDAGEEPAASDAAE
ncbi:MAG: MaoC family dehydratase [Alphaproteobacteria bacterium]